ncbi:MAG: DUF1553 domain-containing protein, partial [Verrucomicrobiales bacterium]|nr:DUF1553 domain-containing protein [Verrucomicrobiales bacterium]
GDVKHIISLITSSHTYRLSSKPSPQLLARDPENHFFARQNRYRLPAETIRDTALAVSGLLVDETGGTSIKPYQPVGYYRHLNFPQRTYGHHTDNRQWRRGVYVHWQRQFLHPMLRAFDAPSREECTAQRPRSNTPTAAMVMLNDPTFVEAARVMAERVLRHGKNNGKANIDFAYQLALSRSPNDLEKEILRGLIRTHLVEYKNDPDAAKQLVAVGQAPVPDDLDPVSLATWTAICRTLLNLDETITRY